MPRFIAVCLAFAFGLVALPAAVSAADIALVIGNSDYRKAPNAESAAADARAVAEALEDGGYEGKYALEYEDGPWDGMEGALYLYREVLAAL